VRVRRSPLRRRSDLALPVAVGALVVLTAAAAAIRLAVPRGLWLDEAISVHQAHLGLRAMLHALAQTDRQPPLYQLALWATVHLGGTSDFAVKLPSILAGTLVVPVLYLLGRELYDRRTAVVAALLGTVAPVLVWYAQEARGYAFVTLFASLAVLGLARVVHGGRAGSWALYALSASALLWTHWFGGLLVLATLALLAVHAARHRPGRGFALGAAACLLVLAAQLVVLAPMATSQVQATGSGGGYAGAAGGGTGVTFYTVTANLTWLLAGFQPPRVTQLLSAIWPLGMLAALLALGRRAHAGTKLLAACALLPPLALLAWGIADPTIFEIRYFIACAPLALVLVARAVTAAPTRAARLGSGAAVVALLVLALVVQQRSPANPRRYDDRAAIAQARRAMGPHDVLLYEPAELGYLLERYAPDLQARPLEGALPTRAEARHVVVIASFLDQQRYKRVVDRQLGALRYGRRPLPMRSFPGVRMWRFS
jgi:uncharacterized membrane protein